MAIIFVLWGANRHSLIVHQRFWRNLLLPSSGSEGKVKSRTSIIFHPTVRSHIPLWEPQAQETCVLSPSGMSILFSPPSGPLFFLWFMYLMSFPRMMYLKSAIPYVSCLDGCYWWMMPVFLPPPLTVSRKNFFFPFRYAAWSLTLWCYERRYKSRWSLADVQDREGMFSPATNSAAAEKLWSCCVLPFSCHWVLGSLGEWMCSNCRTIQLLGGRFQCSLDRTKSCLCSHFMWFEKNSDYIKIEGDKDNSFCFVIKMIKST